MLRLRISLLILTVGCAAWAAPVVITASAAAPTEPAGRADFNGDGYADLAVTTDDVPAVHVIYGSAAGLAAAGNQLWSQGSPGIKGSFGDDGFGHALAVGDFNGDGFGDLAVGAPSEKVGAAFGAGAVNVIYGSAAGLTSAGNQLWSQSSPGVVGAAEIDDAFGWSLATANVGNNAHDDLVIGVFSEDVGTVADAGAVQVLYGSAAGLTAAGNQLWTQDSPQVRSAAEEGDGFGFTVTAGDFGGSAETDIAAGSRYEDVGTVADAGSVHVLFGSSTGLTAAGSQLWTQNTRGVPGAAETDDGFDLSLAAGDFGWDGHADLAWGRPAESTRAGANAGVVTVLYGSDTGLTATGSESWSQDSSGIKGVPEGSWFGSALAAADLEAGRPADLVVGARYERIGGSASGAVHVIYGSAAGLTSAGDQLWSRASPGVKGNAQEATFGSSLAAGNFGNGESKDLAIGAPNATVGEEESAGAVHVLYGSGSGLTANGDQLWSRSSPGLLDSKSFGFGRLVTSSP